MIPDNYILQCIWDKDNRSYYVDASGGIASSATFVPLRNKSIGWQQLECSFDTIEKYFSLVAAQSVPMEYVGDGAEILRFHLYKGRGFEAELYAVFFKWNPLTGLHELEYKGRLDMSKAVDNPEIGVTVSGKPGGMQACLDANEGVTYDIPLDATNPDAIKVYYDGVELFDKLNFKTYDIEMNPVPAGGGYTPLPMFFSNNEGDSVGIIHGDQSYEPTPNFNPYTSTSGNYGFSSAKPITIEIGKNTDGTDQTTRFKWHSDNGASGTIVFFWYTSKSTGGVTTPQKFFEGSALSGDTITVNWRKTITLAAEEKLFIMMGVLAPGANNVTVTPEESTISISYQSINDPSYAWAIRPADLHRQLSLKISDGKYTGASSFFATHNNIVMTSGMALRNLPNAKLPISYEFFFGEYDKQYCMCLNIANDILYIESRAAYYSGNGPTYSAGSISDLKIKVEDGNIVNTVLHGWEPQEHDERNGRYDFNTKNERKLPVTVKKGTLDLVGRAIGSCYSIEFLRGRLNNKDTTDNANDSKPFMVNISDQRLTITDTFVFNFLPGRIDIPNVADVNILEVGEKFTVSGAVLNNGTFTVLNTSPIPGTSGITVFIVEPIAAETVSATITFNIFRLKRVTYDVSPPVNLPTATVFNIEEMTPLDRLLNWAPWLHSVLFQLPNGKITHQNSQKNADLVRVLNGLTKAEKQDLLVASLAAPFFLNYTGQFTAETFLTFNKTFSNLQASTEITANYNGFTIYFLPKGKMASKSVTNEAQEWELLLSAKNNLDTIHKLSQEGLYISNGMDNTLYANIYNPVQWVYYDRQTPSGIKYKGMYDDWVHHRNDQFAIQPGYFQKWELTDPIRCQFITNGLNQLELFIYDNDARQVGSSILSTLTANPLVQSPYTLQQFDLDVSGFAEGNYLFVIKSNGTILIISEWQNISAVQYGTYRYNYKHSYNHLDAYFNNSTGAGWEPVIRVESMFGKPESKFEGNDYEDEPRNLKLIHAEAYEVIPLTIGWSKFYHMGVPDWLQIKMNRILSLNQLLVENIHMVRPAGSQFESSKPSGVPFSNHTIEMRYGSGDMGLTVKDDGTQPIAPVASYTIDAEAYGQAGQVITVEIKP